MDRSTTPRVSQLPQSRRRKASRSRSGSEELSQIFGAITGVGSGAKASGTDADNDEDGGVDGGSVGGGGGGGGRRSQQDATGSPGQRAMSPPSLFGWVRNALQLGPSSGASSSGSPSRAAGTAASPGFSSSSDPIQRNTTPLLPGILPSFHHRGASDPHNGGIREEEDGDEDTDEQAIVGHAGLHSTRSSVSYEASSSHHSLEAYRRSSSYSSASTANSYDDDENEDNDDDEDESEDEDVYAPFSARSDAVSSMAATAATTTATGPTLVRPTARREGISLGFEDDGLLDVEQEQEAFSRSLHGGRAEVSLSIQEARDPHHQIVQDTTPASKVPPSVVLTPPDLSSIPMSPIAGWVEAPPTEGSDQDVPNLHASSKTPVPRDFQRSSSSSSTGESNSRFFSYEAQPSRRSAGPRPVSSCGDGEQIDDFIGRPQSPEDVKRARPSRETVAIGSRQATLRHRRQSERSKVAAAAAADTRQEWDDSSRTKTPTAAAVLDAAAPPAIGDETLPASAPATVVSPSQQQEQEQDQEEQQELGIEPASGQASPSSAVAPAPASAPAIHAPSTLLTSPQPRRAALHFFGRRREASQSSVGSTGEDVIERLADTPTQSAKAKKDSNVASPAGGGFWRLGGKKTAKDDRPSSSAGKQARPSSAGSAPPAALPASATALNSGEVENKEPSPALSRRNSTQVGKPDNKDSSSGAKLCKGKARRLGALDVDMQPMMVKVRAKNKSSKDRDFGRLFLAQELALGGADGSSTPKPRPVSSSGLPSVAASSSPNPSSNTDDAKLPNVESMGSVSSATSSNLSAPNSTSAHKRKKATWAMKFSLDGKYLAVAGQDAVIRVYAVLDGPEARAKLLDEEVKAAALAPPLHSLGKSGSSTSLGSNASSNGLSAPPREDVTASNGSKRPKSSRKSSIKLPNLAVFSPDPVREFRGHTNDILDLSWSKGGFLLSASMDKTARLWHLSWPNSLVSFVHGDFVTSACFHPKDDRFFLSGSLDGKLRLWNISAKKVQKSQEVPGLITATAFTKSGKTACVGTFAGAALFYSTDELQYTSSIAVRSPSGKNAKGGRKITAIEPLCGGLANPSLSTAAQPGAGDQGEDSRVVITSNDSRVRAYDVSQKKLLARWKAKTYVNRTSQIRASVSADVDEDGLLLPGSFVVAGSEVTSSTEGGQVHIWDAGAAASSTGVGKRKKKDSATLSGSEGVPSDEAVEYFTAHAGTVTCAVLAPLDTLDVLAQSDDYIEGRAAEISAAASSSSLLNRGKLGNLGNALPDVLRNVTSSPNGKSADTPQQQQQKQSAEDNKEKPKRNPKWNRIIVSVDESAIVRVWRADSLATVPAP